jgi:hypothetical protein
MSDYQRIVTFTEDQYEVVKDICWMLRVKYPDAKVSGIVHVVIEDYNLEDELILEAVADVKKDIASRSRPMDELQLTLEMLEALLAIPEPDRTGCYE